VEADGRIIRHLDVLEQVESAVVQLQRRALSGFESLRYLQQSQPYLLVGTQQVSSRDAEQQRVSDLPARTRDRDRRRHAMSLRPHPHDAQRAE
jgi:hypothetical protein